MMSVNRIAGGFRSSSRLGAVILCLTLAISGFMGTPPLLADGCFVFKWNKKIDINEPTQKAIIVHEAGREDLLLQVKYEGPLEEFGWLIPVPNVPTVEKGSMQAFYELSQLTQRRFGGFGGATLSSRSAKGGADEGVKVIEIKTVGAYEVAILSASDSGSLGRWLQAHDYSIPEGKAGIIDEYIQKHWFFVAAKIQLDRGVAFKLVSTTAPKDVVMPERARKVIEKQLSSGELHPILISFDTPQCIFPLKISAVGGKPSEVSVYVLSAELLLTRVIFDKELAKIRQERAERESHAEERSELARRSMRNARSLGLAWRMYVLAPPPEAGRRRTNDWTLEDLQSLGEEIQPILAPSLREEGFYPSSSQSLQCMQVTPEKIPQCVKQVPRLKTKTWYLTRQVYSFSPDEMQDLEFQSAIPVLAGTLQNPEGGFAASILAQLGSNAVPVLLSACRSTNSTARINASLPLQGLPNQCPTDLLLALLNDPTPQVRLNAVMATASNWDAQFIDPLMGLFRGQPREIRWQAAQWLGFHESKQRGPLYVALLQDPDPDVPECALHVLAKIDPGGIPRSELVRLLGCPKMEIVSQALTLLQGGQSSVWPAQPPTIAPGYQAREERLSSQEAAPLTTNRLTLARLAGLKILYGNADTQALALTIPMLRDTNSIVRTRAFALVKKISGEDIPQDDPVKWEEWWSSHWDTFQTKPLAR